MQAVRSISCERTRALVSGALDGRLHDLERRFLDAHLGRCDACSTFATDVDWFTDAMRSAPLEVAPPVVLPRLRRRVQLSSLASVAAAAVVLVVAGNVALTMPTPDASEHALVGTAVTEDPLEVDSLQALLRDALTHGRLAMAPVEEDRSLGATKPVLPAIG